ncbi:MAG: DUF2520 domain-containing protein [Bacteroidia bacterium]
MSFSHPGPLRCTVVGTGSLAMSMIPALQGAGYPVTQLLARNETTRELYGGRYGIVARTGAPHELAPDSELVLLCVSDQAIAPVAASLLPYLPPQALLVHCSGSIPLDAMAGPVGRRGVLYPLQTFTRTAAVPLHSVPIFVEGEADAHEPLRHLADRLSERVFALDSDERRRLHLAAVFVNNFSNLLYRIAADLLPAGLDFGVFEPIVHEHVRKVLAYQPAHSQSGPALRGDRITLASHLALLREHPEWQALYRYLSGLINPDMQAWLQAGPEPGQWPD